MIIYYDSYCKLCTRTAAIWRKLDWRRKLIFKSFRELPNYPPAMEEALHIKKEGKWFKGYPAVIEISKALPPLWPFVPCLYLAKWAGLGNAVYRMIAKNRTLLPVGKCENGACEIHRPPRN